MLSRDPWSAQPRSRSNTSVHAPTRRDGVGSVEGLEAGESAGIVCLIEHVERGACSGQVEVTTAAIAVVTFVLPADENRGAR